MKILILLLLFVFFGTCSYSQGLVIHSKDGSSTTHSLALIDSITFILIPQQILFFDDFEGGNLNGYDIPLGHTPPELTSIASFSQSNSVTLISPRNNYSVMGRPLSPPVSNNIIGYNCKMMKNNLSDQSNMMIILFTGSVSSEKEIVLGFNVDSIFIAIQNNSNPGEDRYLTFGPIQENRWYDFSIEYNFATQKCSFFIDGVKIYDSNYTVSSIDYFYLGDYGSDNPPELDKVLFIDDIKLYKR